MKTRQTVTACWIAFSTILGAATAARGQAVFFKRSDSNADGRLDLSDAVRTLGFLFLGTEAPTCLDACDSNDDGKLDLSDGVHSLGYLFLGNPPPAPPGLQCGHDPTEDGLTCMAYRSCQQPVVPIQVIDEFAVVEGDIIVGKAAEIPLEAIEGGGSGGGYAVQEGFTILGIRFAGFRWPGGVIPFRIDASIPATSPNPMQPTQATVNAAIQHWQANTSILFVQRTNQANFVTFRSGGGCASDVGMKGGEQVITLGLGCLFGQAVHEIGHAVGLWHEQSRSDRDDFVRILWDNIQDDMKFNFEKKSGLLYGDYDYGSIMHYSATAFAKAGCGCSTIETIPPGTSIGQRNGLSAGDIAAVAAMYPVAPAGWTTWSQLGSDVDRGKSIAVAVNQDTRLEVFVRGSDDGLYHAWENNPLGSWSGWDPLYGVLTGGPVVGQNWDGRLEVFVRGTDTAIYHRWQEAPNGGWNPGWESLGGELSSTFAVAKNSDGRLELFALGPTNDVWHNWQVTVPVFPMVVVGWWNWTRLGNPDDKGIHLAVGENIDGRIEVFLTGTARDLWHAWQSFYLPTGWIWSGWSGMGGSDLQELAAGRNQDGRLEVFVRGGDNAIWHQWQVSPGGTWSDWGSLGGILASAPIVGQNQDGRLEIFALGTDAAVLHNRQTEPNGGWSGWATLGKPPAGASANIAVARNAAGRIQVFVLDSSGRIWHIRQT